VDSEVVTKGKPITGHQVTGSPASEHDWRMGMGDFAAEVRRFMKARGMSLRETARAAGYSDHTLLSKVLNGHKPVTPYLAACLDEALAADGAIVAAARVAANQAEAARLPLRELADHAAELGQWAESGSAGPGTIAGLEDEIARIARDYTTSPPGPLIVRASEVCRRVSGLLRQHQRLRYARDLYVVGARCCAFLGVALGDLGQQTESATYARTALILAEESADPSAIAMALSALSKVAFWDNRHRHAADLAARGYSLTRPGDPVRVLLACQEADAAPVPRAREALALASAALRETEIHDVGLFSCGGVRLAAYTGTLRLREGDFTGVIAAVADADTAVRDGEDYPFGSFMQAQISAALAMLATGNAEQAAARLTQVFNLPADMRLATFNGKLSHAAVLASAGPYRGSPAAHGIAEQVRVYLGQQDGDVMPYPLAIGSGAGE
jgi:transcriptional regulator with XRE-family HTH domain